MNNLGPSHVPVGISHLCFTAHGSSWHWWIKLDITWQCTVLSLLCLYLVMHKHTGLSFTQCPSYVGTFITRLFLGAYLSMNCSLTTDRQKQVVICFEHTIQLLFVMIFFLHCEKACLTEAFMEAFSVLWDGMSWIYYCKWCIIHNNRVYINEYSWWNYKAGKRVEL